jgi:hypothetical protein
MATNHPDHGPDDSLIRNPEVAYDHRDLSARGILVFLAILGIVGIAVHFLIYGMYRGMQKYAESQDPALHALAPKTAIPTPGIVPANAPINLQQFPTPRLQSDDASDMRTFLSQEDRLLHAQPWKDEAGKVHIPIGMAIDLISKRGLPSRNGAVPDEGQGIAIAGAQPPAGQTDSGNINLNEVQGQADAVTVPGAPKGDTSGKDEKQPQ